MRISHNELAEQVAEKYVDGMSTSDLAAFVYEEMYDFYRKYCDYDRLDADARALGIVDEDEPLEIIEADAPLEIA